MEPVVDHQEGEQEVKTEVTVTDEVETERTNIEENDCNEVDAINVDAEESNKKDLEENDCNEVEAINVGAEDSNKKDLEEDELTTPCKTSEPEDISKESVVEEDSAPPEERETRKIVRTPHPMSRSNTLKKQESGDVTRLSLMPNYDTSHDELDVDDDDEELRKLSWDSEVEDRADLGLEDGTSLKVQAWDTNSEDGKYLTGIEAQRVIVEGMRKRVETMKTLLTPGYSNSGSVFNFPPGSVAMRKSISSTDDSDEVFRGKIILFKSKAISLFSRLFELE